MLTRNKQRKKERKKERNRTKTIPRPLIGGEVINPLKRHVPPLKKNSPKSFDNFLSNLAARQTNRKTDTGKNITSQSFGGGNNYCMMTLKNSFVVVRHRIYVKIFAIVICNICNKRKINCKVHSTGKCEKTLTGWAKN